MRKPTPISLFLDLNLPKLSGVEVLGIATVAPVSVCILTGSSLERDEVKKKFGIRRIACQVKPHCGK